MFASFLRSRSHIRFLALLVAFVSIEIWITRHYLPSLTLHKIQPRLANRSSKAVHKRKFFLVIGILSKRSALERRMAIRDTWMTVCQRMDDVMCIFFTDRPTEAIVKEIYKYRDVVPMPYSAGYNFGLRLLWMYAWATERFDFDYFLRVDDDYFLCLEHLHYDLLHRPRHGLYWGYIHCEEFVVRVDEGWLLMSADIIREAIAKRNSTLLCHPIGDQEVAIWVSNSGLNITYFDDSERVIHFVTAFDPYKFLRHDICTRYLGLHGSYPSTMKQYWILSTVIDKKLTGKVQKSYSIPEIIPLEKKCKYEKKFDWRRFWPDFRFEPRLCRLEPRWDFKTREYSGREKLL